MKQKTLSAGSFDRYGKTTRRAVFLAEIGLKGQALHITLDNLNVACKA